MKRRKMNVSLTNHATIGHSLLAGPLAETAKLGSKAQSPSLSKKFLSVKAVAKLRKSL